jgi:phage shock protein E
MSIFILLLGVSTVACNPLRMSPQISQADLLAQMAAPPAPLILDVRTAEEYAAGHIPGAVNIDVRSLSQYLETHAPPSHHSLVVYCERGIRAQWAERMLVNAGYGPIFHLEGDMVAWRAQSLPLETLP